LPKIVLCSIIFDPAKSFRSRKNRGLNNFLGVFEIFIKNSLDLKTEIAMMIFMVKANGPGKITTRPDTAKAKQQI